jgi:hypothetical protein
LIEIKRFYVQNGKTIPNSVASVTGVDAVNSITDKFCSEQKTAFSDTNVFANMGGLKKMGQAFSSSGMVLVMSIWDDHAANCLWVSVFFFFLQISFSITLFMTNPISSSIPATQQLPMLLLQVSTVVLAQPHLVFQPMLKRTHQVPQLPSPTLSMVTLTAPSLAPVQHLLVVDLLDQAQLQHPPPVVVALAQVVAALLHTTVNVVVLAGLAQLLVLLATSALSSTAITASACKLSLKTTNRSNRLKKGMKLGVGLFTTSC